ncbi:hypothetical protein AB6805_13715 [Chitinophaga sp. RCC_12]|uniref:hypothetical protein n=1 Tax=Chitinophaga sp. RCC_12 TaxID=3239226 RepID=UPI0035258548
MKYYRLNLSSEPKIIGVKNGIYQVEIDKKKYSSPKDYDRLLNFFSSQGWFEKDQTPDFDVQIHANMLKSAIMTDFLQFSPALMACDFMVNNKVLDVFKDFNIQKHTLFPVTIYQGSRVIDDNYSLFFMPHLEYDVIDFPKSTFFSGNRILGKQHHQFEDLTQFRTALKEISPLIGVEVLHLNEKFDKKLDLFRGRLGRMNISEHLKDAIVSANLTGIKLTETEEPKIVVP